MIFAAAIGARVGPAITTLARRVQRLTSPAARLRVGAATLRVGLAVGRFVSWVTVSKKRSYAVFFAVMFVGMPLAMTVHAAAQILTPPSTPPTPASCQPGPPGLIDQTSSSLDALMTQWPQEMISAGAPLFWGIFGLAIVIALAFEMPGAFADFKAAPVTLARILFVPVLCAGVYFQTPSLGPALVSNMLSTTALSTSGLSAPAFTSLSGIQPGAAFNKFACVGDKIYNSTESAAYRFDLITNPLPTLVDAAEQFISIWASYIAGALAMVELFLFKFEVSFVLGIGAILMVGIAASVFYGYPLRYLGALIGLGLKGIGLSLLLGIMLAEADKIAGSSFGTGSGPIPPHDLMVISVTFIILGVASWFLPNLLATLGGATSSAFGTTLAAGAALGSLVTKALSGEPAAPSTPSGPTESGPQHAPGPHEDVPPDVEDTDAPLDLSP